MSKLKIAYSHEKEQLVAEGFTDKLKKMGRSMPNLTEPADTKKVDEKIKELTKAWEPQEGKFIQQLNWFYDCDFDLAGWIVYLIRFPICPYYTKEKWFGVSFNPVEKQLKTIGHELFHQPFHLYWEEKCKKIFPDLVVPSLKEALPELLNTPEFKLSNILDKGHSEPGEQFIRHLIRKYYQTHGPFKFQEFLQSVS